MPKITDFGLARRLDEEGLTQTGDVLGTPGYMAPEQAVGRGRQGEPATDVYSLGAILYELLTGRPPFRGETVLETLEQVRTLDPVPPRRLRPGLPRELETICLKCLDKEPGRRYASAGALADDLGRFLEGRPILARPVGLVGRLLKWMRRRPAIALLTGLCLAAGVALLVGALVYEHRLRQALGQTQTERERARGQAERADGNYRQARDALTKMLERAEDRRWDGVTRVQELRRGQYEDALAFHERIAAQQGDDPEVRAGVAWALLAAAKIRMQLGRGEQAAADLRRAIELARVLTGQEPGELDHRILLAEALNSLVAAEHLQGPLALAEEAVAVLEEVVRQHPGRHVFRRTLADDLINWGAALLAQGQAEKAEPALVRAVALLDELARQEPGRGHELVRARARINLGSVYNARKQPDRMRQQNALAETELEACLKESPDNVHAIEGLASIRINRAYELMGEGKRDEGLTTVSRNLPLLEQARRREPEQARFTDLLYRTHGVRATLLEQLGRIPESIADLEQAASLASPGDRLGLRVSLVILHLRMGDYQGGAAEADRVAKEALDRHDDTHWANLSRFYRQAADLAEKDMQLSPEERRRLCERYRAASATMLGRAATASLRRWLPQPSARPATPPPAGR
jgi:tetratricopeptide (TPR) repeat protein